MANVKNILVGAARVFISNGSGASRPDLSSAAIFPWNISGSTNTFNTAASAKSTSNFLTTTASSYFRDIGYTSNGVEISYEPGYSDVMVDQLLDAARLFKQSVRVLVRTEMDEGTLENIHVVLGQAEQVLANDGTLVNTLTTTAANSVTQLNLSAGAIGDAPVERTLVLVGQAPAQSGLNYATSGGVSASSGSVAGATTINLANTIKKERVYAARRVVQVETVSHALKRDGATVFPVQFRCLPEDGAGYGAGTYNNSGSEYGFIIDRVWT